MSDLRPCPFCASHGEVTYVGGVFGGPSVGCSNERCAACTIDMAPEAWNRRTNHSDAAIQAIREALQQIRSIEATGDHTQDILRLDLCAKIARAALAALEAQCDDLMRP